MQQGRKVPGSIPTDTNAARRYKSVQPMELYPGNWAEPRAMTWGMRILDKPKMGLNVPHEPRNPGITVLLHKSLCTCHSAICASGVACV